MVGEYGGRGLFGLTTYYETVVFVLWSIHSVDRALKIEESEYDGDKAAQFHPGDVNVSWFGSLQFRPCFYGFFLGLLLYILTRYIFGKQKCSYSTSGRVDGNLIINCFSPI